MSDKKIGVDNNSDGVIDYYNADVITASDYYPFGMQMPGRKYSQPNNSYRYGFNGKENDNDVKGEGNQQDYGMRIYDPRLGRFLSVDPLTSKYSELTPYQFASNRPIDGIDLDGAEYLRYPAALRIKLSLVTDKSGAITKQEYGQLFPQNLPNYYKAMGATTQAKFEKAFKSTQHKLQQMNEQDPPPSNRAEAIGAALGTVAQGLASMTPEVKAFEEMSLQIGAGKAAVSLADAGAQSGLLPSQFSGDLNFRENLTNYLLDGSLTASGSGELLKNYNKVIQSIGDELYANKEKVLGGTYQRKTKETKVHTATRGLDYMQSGYPKILGIEERKIDPPYTEALNKYNNTKPANDCVNCTTIQPSSSK